METENVKGELYMFRPSPAEGTQELKKDGLTDGLKSHSYDDISSDAGSEAVDIEKQVDAVADEPEKMVEGGSNLETAAVETEVDVGNVNTKSVDYKYGSSSDKKHSSEAVDVTFANAEEKLGLVKDENSQESMGEDDTRKHLDYLSHHLDKHSDDKQSEPKVRLDSAFELKTHEPHSSSSKAKEHGASLSRNAGHPGNDYRSGFKHSLYGRNSPMERCSPPNFSSDSDTDYNSFKSHNQRLIKNLLSSERDWMKFAETLYKCTLCTSIPSILTSKSSFLKHVKEQHFTTESCVKRCEFCSLKFRTDEDLKEHVRHLHKETNQSADTPSHDASHDQTKSDVPKSHDTAENENDSDSDSSGHRNYKAKLVKKIKPSLDFENPKQLVDHTGIQTLDGSLDLSKKETSANKTEQKEHTISVKAEKKSPKHTQEPNMVHVQQITDQIMKSNFQGQRTSTPSSPLSFTPSFTQEFGKYTKLVREGGNIVYFCQVCNWKSPIKATFHGHCGTAAHKSKVIQTEDPDSADSKSLQSPGPPSSSVSCDRTSSSRSSPNSSASATSEAKARDSTFWSGPGQRGSYLSKGSEASGLYSQFAQPRGVSYNGRSQVASPFKNGSSSSSSERPNPFKRTNESASDFHKVAKKSSHSSTSAKKGKARGCSSDSDSDDGNNNSKSKETPFSPWNKHLEMASLYQNYPFLPFCNPARFSYDRLYSSTVSSHKPSGEVIIKTEPDVAESSKNASQLFSFSTNTNKRPVETATADHNEDTPNKKSKDGKPESSEMKKDGAEKSDSLFKLYKCHACAFEYSDIEEYEKHFEEVHKSGNPGLDEVHKGGSPSEGAGGGQGYVNRHAGRMPEMGGADFETGENFRVAKLKEILSEYVMADEKGNIPRDYLLQCISLRGIPNVELWSSACNKAMREVFPQSMAQRKGKYKKTYYFGVSMVESYQAQEEPSQQTESDPQLYNPLRDLNLDMEKIMEQLPAVLYWTGSQETGVYRGEILMVIAETLQNQDILNWGPQCNRAIRLVFPKVDIKRKGKFKSTMYFGVDFHSSVKKAPFFSQTKGMPIASGLFEGGDMGLTGLAPPSASSGATAEGFARGEEFPEWMRQEAQKNMKWYLQRFGGVTGFDTGEADNVGDDDDNDGDDEGESVESSVQ